MAPPLAIAAALCAVFLLPAILAFEMMIHAGRALQAHRWPDTRHDPWGVDDDEARDPESR